MKRLFFAMVIANAMIISFNSCDKDNYLPPKSTDPGPSGNSTTMSVTTDHWEAKGNGIFVSTFWNVIPSHANQSINVYAGGEEILNQRGMGGVLWAAVTETDLVITYRGNSQTVPPRLTITVVIKWNK